MKEYLIEEIVSETYEKLDVPRDRSRITDRAQTRAAVGQALSVHFNHSQIAKSLKIDRTTVSHYKRNHKENLNHWIGYKNKYEVAEYITKNKVYLDVSEISIESVKEQIKNLQRKLDYLMLSV